MKTIIGTASLLTFTNPKTIRAAAVVPDFVSAEAYQVEPNGHKFKVGETRTLVGLEDFPEYNGDAVVISAIREDGKYGKAYYIQGRMEKDGLCNWVYEYRLK